MWFLISLLFTLLCWIGFLFIPALIGLDKAIKIVRLKVKSIGVFVFASLPLFGPVLQFE